MDRKCRNIISKFLGRLKKDVDLKKIKPLVEKRKIFTKPMLDDIYYLSNDSELFYDLLCTRGPYAFAKFINILSQSGYRETATLLQNEFSNDYTPMPYKMTSDPIGFCLIIINENFQSLDTRIGSLIDATALESLFESLGYIVTVVWDLSGLRMEDCLLQFSQNPNFSQVDSIVVFILTHGDRINNCDVLLGTDTVPVFISDIYTMFDNKNCPRMLGKPKMFFFQACRGSMEDIGYFESKYTSSDAVPYRESTDAEIFTIVHHPSMTDVIAVHSTLPYHTSLRDHEEGSWLCQDIVDVFSVDYQRHDLDLMLKSVSRRMEERISDEKTKQTIHVELFGVKGIVKFSPEHAYDYVRNAAEFVRNVFNFGMRLNDLGEQLVMRLAGRQ